MEIGLRHLLLCGVLAGSAATGFNSAQAADLTIRLAWYMPPHTAVDQQGTAIAKNIESLSDGRIKVDTYPSGSLLKESNMAQGLGNNTANMGIMAMHWWAKYEPALEWDTIPFLVDDAGTLLKALHGKLGQDINAHMNKHGVQIVGWGFYGYAESYVNSRHPIKVPADLKGLKMRSEGKLSAKFLAAQGATPVAVDSSEVYTALQRGSLDGAVSGLSSIVSRKWYEVGHDITAIHYVPLVYPVQVNLKWWKGLSPDDRELISKAVASTEAASVQNIEDEFKHDIALARDHGNAIYEPTEDDLKEWKATAGEQARKDYVAEVGEPGKQILQDVKAALAQS